MKEISYIHSEAYAAGELKHGTISLVEPGTLVIGVATQPELLEKTVSNMVETGARGAYLCAVTFNGNYSLEDRADFFPHQLSGGQRRRAMAARALLHKPSLILADEPTNDLDEKWSQEIIRALQEEAARGAGVVMVTHNSQWAQFATRRCCLEDGRLVDTE